MKYQANNEVCIGIDSIQLVVHTNEPLRVNGEIVNSHDLVCKRTKQIIGTIEHCKGRRQGYSININLPKCICQDNKKPFGKEDGHVLSEIGKMINGKIKSLFGSNYDMVKVSVCEVNATAKLTNYKNVDAILNMIRFMLLQDGEKFNVWIHGKRYNSKRSDKRNLITEEQIESIKFKCSNGRCSMRFYNKGLEQGCIEQGLLRIEFRYYRCGLDFAKAGNTIEEFLTVSSLKNVIEVFKKDYKKYFINKYWNDKNGNKFYKKCIEDILDSLEKTKKPSMAILMNKRIAEIDIRLVELAFRRYYSNYNSYRRAIKRIREKSNIEINENVINDFVQISRTIIHG